MKTILVGILAMMPVIELRGAIPYAIANNVPVKTALLVAIICNIIPVIPIYFYAQRVLIKAKTFKYIGNFCKKILTKGEELGSKLEKRLGNSVYLSIFLFVAIPIPGTGVWSATLAASILKLNYKKVVISNFLGVIIAGIIMTSLSKIIENIIHMI